MWVCDLSLHHLCAAEGPHGEIRVNIVPAQLWFCWNPRAVAESKSQIIKTVFDNTDSCDSSSTKHPNPVEKHTIKYYNPYKETSRGWEDMKEEWATKVQAWQTVTDYRYWVCLKLLSRFPKEKGTTIKETSRMKKDIKKQTIARNKKCHLNSLLCPYDIKWIRQSWKENDQTRK